MARRYDLEMVLADIKSIMTTHLNTKLAAIDTEKNDGIVLKTIAADAYALQNLTQKVMNYDPFIQYGVSDVSTNGQGPHSAETFQLVAAVLLVDSGQDAQMMTRLFRYRRALKEIFEDNWKKMSGGVQMKIEGGLPAEMQEAKTQKAYRVIGVFIEVTVA